MWSVNEIAKAVKGTIYKTDRSDFSAISTDSRGIGPGEFFVPLRGPNFDGHLYIDQAYARSGGGCLCDRSRPEIYGKAQGTVVLVDNSDEALLDLARYKRAQATVPFVGITGSNGKTTTKELLVHLVGDAFPIIFNEKNFNNQIGVAKTLIAMEGNPHYVIMEVGTNHKGEIALLAEMVRPSLSLITNVNPSHLEGLMDIEGVREEKLDLFRLTLKGGTTLVNVDDPHLASYRPADDSRSVVTFGIEKKADYRLEVTQNRGLAGFAIRIGFSDGTLIDTRTLLLGRHNLYNVLAAASLAHSMGVQSGRLQDALPSFVPYKGRFNPIKSAGGYTVIDDSYNANPASMQWAVSTLAAMPCSGRKIAVIGDMKELGEKENYYHQELGRTLRGSNLSMVLFLGEATGKTFEEMNNGTRAQYFEDRERLIAFVSSALQPDDIVLVKGSRSLGMDKIVEALV